MKVKMLVPTYWGGKQLKPGDTPEVDDAVAARWEKAKIAEIVAEKPKKVKKSNDPPKDPPEEDDGENGSEEE